MGIGDWADQASGQDPAQMEPYGGRIPQMCRDDLRQRSSAAESLPSESSAETVPGDGHCHGLPVSGRKLEILPGCMV